MNIRNIHLYILILILGAFSLQSLKLDSFSKENLFLKTDIEESFKSIELDFEKQLLDSYSGGDGNAIISNQNLSSTNTPIAKFTLENNNSKDLSKLPQLFILYCCLKLDC